VAIDEGISARQPAVRIGKRPWRGAKMNATNATLMSATATVLIALFYFYTGFRVGNLRGRHNIQAPACSGHPEFDRAYRVQMNTLEQMAITLPMLWIATLFPVGPAWLPAAVGLVWVIVRILYMRAYMADPAKRLVGAGLTGLCNVVLLILSILGVAIAWSVALR
jgi:glutathione S-transferase